MSGQPEGQSEETEKGKPPKPRPAIVRIFRALKRYENRRRRRRNSQHQVNERMMARWTRHVGLFTGALVVVGIVTAVIFWRQLNVMQSQLEEMRKGAVDTAELAKAAKSSAAAANSANQLNEVGLRPWVDFNVIEPSAGFVVKRDAVSVGIRYSLKNVGRLPATMTNVHLEMQPLAYYGPQIDLVNEVLVTDYQVRACKKSEYTTGNTVFPGQTINPYIVTVEADRNRFEDIIKQGKEIYVVLITGCVGYKLAIAGSYGHTGVSLIIARGTNTNVLPLGLPSEGIVRLEETIKMRVPLQFAN